MIIHYVGDVHQPLHSTALVDSEYPSGDRGGNSEHIPSIDGVSNLHAVWDSVLYTWTGYPNTVSTLQIQQLNDDFDQLSEFLCQRDFNALLFIRLHNNLTLLSLLYQPLDDEDWAWYTETADQLNTDYPIDQDEIWPGMFEEWAIEGFEMSKLYVYPGKQRFQLKLQFCFLANPLISRLD